MNTAALTADRTPDTAGLPARTGNGAIVLARHGEPALSRRVKLDSEGYRRWWALYEEGGLLAGQAPPDGLLKLAAGAMVIASTRRRSIETARALCGEDGGFRPDEIFIEAPLPPPRLPGVLRFSPRTWGVIARISWWLGHHQGHETRQDAERRARKAAEHLASLADRGEEVLVLAHGYFNAMIGAELKRLGWRCVLDQGFRYWSQRRFERR
jgi:broad specificity phosphatase PhoE